jgi:hypothetical protein
MKSPTVPTLIYIAKAVNASFYAHAISPVSHADINDGGKGFVPVSLRYGNSINKSQKFKLLLFLVKIGRKFLQKINKTTKQPNDLPTDGINYYNNQEMASILIL